MEACEKVAAYSLEITIADLSCSILKMCASNTKELHSTCCMALVLIFEKLKQQYLFPDIMTPFIQGSLLFSLYWTAPDVNNHIVLRWSPRKDVLHKNGHRKHCGLCWLSRSEFLQSEMAVEVYFLETEPWTFLLTTTILSNTN